MAYPQAPNTLFPPVPQQDMGGFLQDVPLRPHAKVF